MSDIGATIRAAVIADAGVSALTTRMFSDALPQTVTLPAISYFVVATRGYGHVTGTVAAFASATIQIDCYAVSRPAATELANTVRLALQKKLQGDNSGQFIHEIELESGERQTFDRVKAGSDQRRYISSQDFMVHYTATTS